MPVTIVGVTPREFPSLHPGVARDLWLPISLQARLQVRRLFTTSSGDHPYVESGDDNWWLYIVGRLAPGIRLEQAQSAADVLFRNDVLQQQGSHSLFQTDDGRRIAFTAAPDVVVGMRDRVSTTLTILMSAVCTVLLIAARM